MTATKDIRLVLARGQFERMRQARYGYEPVVEFIRTAIDREIRLRTGASHLAAPPEHLPGPVDDLVELIEDQLRPSETIDKFIRHCVAQGLKLRLQENLRLAQGKAPEAPVNRIEEKRQVTACSPLPAGREATPGAAKRQDLTPAEKAEALLRRLAEKKKL